MSGLRAWFQIARISAAPTAISNALMGYYIARGSFGSLAPLLLMVVGATAIYTAGMILNDWADADVDAKERPGRPIPSGAISRRTAGMVGYTTLLGGWGIVVIASVVAQQADLMISITRTVVLVSLLVVAVLAYDLGLKRTRVGAVVMGLCRLLLVLLAGSVAAWNAGWLGLTPIQWLVAGAIGVYIVGITMIARREANVSQAAELRLGALAIVIAILALAIGVPWVATEEPGKWFDRLSPLLFAMLMVLGVLSFGGRLVRALQDRQANSVQAAVGSGLFSLIAIDAILCFFASSDAGRLLAIAPFVALSFIAIWLRRWIRPT